MSYELHLWTIYQHPKDFPEGYVVREWIQQGDRVTAGTATRHPTLEEARGFIPPGLYRLMREPGDEPQVLETWL